MKRVLLLILFVGIFSDVIYSKTPYLFKLQEKRVYKHILKYLPGDTIIKTSGANIHLHYSNSPNKPYLLLIHGMGVNGRTNWYNQIKDLSRHYNLVVPDLVYFGESKAVLEDYSVEFQAVQLHEALSLLGFNNHINVMGFSYGGLTASIYNELFSAEVNKLIVVDAPVKYYSSSMADSMASVSGVKNMSNILVPINEYEFKAMIKAAVFKSIPTSKRFKRKFIRHYFDPVRELRIKQLDYLSKNETKYQNYNYGFNKTQTLLIWGQNDGVVPVIVGKTIHEKFPETTRLVVYPKAKHDAHFSYSKKLNREVINFLAQ